MVSVMSKMNFKEAKNSVLNWIENFVEKTNPELNGLPPCPYARRSRLENRLTVLEGHEVFSDVVNLVIQWNDDYDVVVFVYDRHSYTVDTLSKHINTINKKYALPNDILVLEDHPDNLELVNGVSMNQGRYILLLCQRFSKVNLASTELKGQGYYDLWSKEYYDQVVGWREQYVFDDS